MFILDDLAAKDTTYTTARTLLAILRLAQAHAKLHRREKLHSDDVEEAIRLMRVARDSIDQIVLQQKRSRRNNQ